MSSKPHVPRSSGISDVKPAQPRLQWNLLSCHQVDSMKRSRVEQLSHHRVNGDKTGSRFVLPGCKVARTLHLGGGCNLADLNSYSVCLEEHLCIVYTISFAQPGAVRVGVLLTVYILSLCAQHVTPPLRGHPWFRGPQRQRSEHMRAVSAALEVRITGGRCAVFGFQ